MSETGTQRSTAELPKLALRVGFEPTTSRLTVEGTDLYAAARSLTLKTKDRARKKRFWFGLLTLFIYARSNQFLSPSPGLTIKENLKCPGK